MPTEGALTSQSSMKCYVRMDTEDKFLFMIFESKTKYLKDGCKRALFVFPILISAERLEREKKQNKTKQKQRQKSKEINKT